jgi:tetratricopeptide (TPR) repeat protein
MSLAPICVFGQEEASSNGEDTTKWGSNPDNCKMNLSLYVEFYRQKNFDDAYQPWSEVFRTCPKASKNTYIHGTAIVLTKVAKEKDAAIQKKYIDTLMMVYDQRIQYFGEEGKVLGMKALQWNKLYPKDIEKSYALFKKSVELEKENSDPAVVNMYMQLCVDLFNVKKVADAEVFSVYGTCSDIITALNLTNPGDEKLATAQNNLDVTLVKTGIVTCEKIVSIYQAKFDANKNDLSLAKAIVRLLDGQGCSDSKLYAEAAEKQYELDPSATSAYAMARYFVKNGANSKAADYYKKAVELQEDPLLKAKYYYELAAVTGTMLNQYSAGRTYALKAIELKKDWGDPYILIGQIYAISSKDCGAESFDQLTVFWAVIDKFVQAKSVDPSCAEEANKQINKYSQYFPKKEDGFFRNISEGQSYTIGCWINETTKARFL